MQSISSIELQALPPIYQDENEREEILKDQKLKEILSQYSASDWNIWKIGAPFWKEYEKCYLLHVLDEKGFIFMNILVKVHYLPIKNLGPQKFEFTYEILPQDV